MNRLIANIKHPITNIPNLPPYVKNIVRTFFRKALKILVLGANPIVFGV